MEFSQISFHNLSEVKMRFDLILATIPYALLAMVLVPLAILAHEEMCRKIS